jgi:phage tail sheath gpL-like
MAKTTIIIDHDDATIDTRGFLASFASLEPKQGLHALGRFFKAAAGGALTGIRAIVKREEVQASGTITLDAFVEDDTVTINGVVFTGKAAPAGAQQFAVNADDAVTAANLAAKINASALAKIVGVVTATSALKVVTVTAVAPGLVGNVCTLAISAHGSVSGANLAGGATGAQSDLDLR